MPLPIQSYRKWAQVLERGGARFVRKDGKNHLVWAYRPPGNPEEVTVGIAAHSDGADVKPKYIHTLRRVWRLRTQDGVSDHEFLNGTWPHPDQSAEAPPVS